MQLGDSFLCCISKLKHVHFHFEFPLLITLTQLERFCTAMLALVHRMGQLIINHPIYIS